MRAWGYRFSVLFCLIMALMPGVSAQDVELPVQEPVPLGDRILSWACVYGQVPVRVLEQSLAGLLVIDPDHYQTKDLPRLKRGGRIVLAYVSVGEAEGYRSYFRAPAMKDLVVSENPDWPQNFRLRFWDSRWSDMLKGYCADIAGKGFDGFFFDVVDAWEELRERDPQAREKMLRFLTGLADDIRARHPEAIILFQNSHELFQDERIVTRFDGFVQEGLFHSWQPGRVPREWQKEKISAMEKIRSGGKFVGILEYTRNPFQMKSVKMAALRHGFIPYFAEKNLETLFPLP